MEVLCGSLCQKQGVPILEDLLNSTADPVLSAFGAAGPVLHHRLRATGRSAAGRGDVWSCLGLQSEPPKSCAITLLAHPPQSNRNEGTAGALRGWKSSLTTNMDPEPERSGWYMGQDVGLRVLLFFAMRRCMADSDASPTNVDYTAETGRRERRMNKRPLATCRASECPVDTDAVVPILGGMIECQCCYFGGLKRSAKFLACDQ